MTILQKEVQERSQAISTMGNLMAGGVVILHQSVKAFSRLDLQQ